MIIGMILIKIMAAGADIFDQLAGQGFMVDLDSSNKSFCHPDIFVAQNQLSGGTDHTVIHIPNVMDEIESAQTLGQD